MNALSDLIRMRPPATSHNADFLIKMNLPPIMGRRDAACDCIGFLLKTDFTALPDTERMMLYDRLIQLLTLAIGDTRSLLQMLSNQETRSREEWLLSFFHLLGYGLEPLLPISGLAKNLENAPQIAAFLEDDSLNFGETGTHLLQDEKSLVEHLQKLYQAAEIHISRYREYAEKSFSKPFAERYGKAYREYRKLCQEAV